MKLSLPVSPTPEEVAAAQAAVDAAVRDVDAAQSVYHTALRASEEAKARAAKLAVAARVATFAADFAARNRGHLIQSSDGRFFGALTGNGVSRRSIDYVATTYHGGEPCIQTATVYNQGNRHWSESRTNGGDIWVEVTE
jgi:hypothetical protein